MIGDHCEQVDISRDSAAVWVADQEWEEDAGVSQSVLTGVWWLGGVEAAEDGWVRFQALPAA